jgi:predicted kinase
MIPEWSYLPSLRVTIQVVFKGGALMLIAFCGLPGTGKTTLARGLARRLQAAYLRIDTIEEVLLAEDGAPLVARGAGYAVAYAVAEDNLKLGRTVIADSVNAIGLTREAWRDVAKRCDVSLVEVAVTCGDRACHQRRIEARRPGTRASTWSETLSREFDTVDEAAIAIDTSVRTTEECIDDLLAALNSRTS